MTVVIKFCESCGEKFKPKKKQQRFCKHSCAVKTNRKKIDWGYRPSDFRVFTYDKSVSKRFKEETDERN